MGKTGDVCSVKDTGAFIKFERDHAAQRVKSEMSVD